LVTDLKDALYITDSNRNIIAKVDDDGLNTTQIKVNKNGDQYSGYNTFIDAGEISVHGTFGGENHC
jgi:hypothetical protein